ncbi:MAG: O-antigen ligase family protein [Bacteroidales bacterium]|nr:O-antigen ligase family protein [Bacteroidales bacterium]
MNWILFFSRANRYLSFIFAFSLSLFVKALPILIAVWILSFAMQRILSRKIQLRITPSQGMSIGLYLLYVLGLFWSIDTKAFLFALEVKLSLLVFPLMIGYNSEFFKENKNHILLFFILGIMVSSLASLSLSIWNSTFFLADGLHFHTIDPEFAKWAYGGSRFRYLGLSHFLHPTYFSFYVLFAFVNSLVFLKRRTFSQKYVLISLKASIPLFVLMIYLLSSKAVLISAVFIFMMLSFLLYQRYTNKLIKGFILIFILSIIIGTLNNPRFKSIKRAFNHPELLADTSKGDSFISRIHIWKAGIEVIEDHFLFGVGPGDTNKALIEKYKYYHYKDPLFLKSNAHNQYIETWIDLGLVGFVALVLVLFIPLLIAKKRNILLMVFLFIMGFNFLFESILNTQAGVVFFGFFYSLLSIVDVNENEVQSLPI